jgi:hypothetical protein
MALEPMVGPVGVGGENVTVTVEGYIRGAPMSANQLVHLPGIGDFPVERVSSAAEPCGRGKATGRGLHSSTLRLHVSIFCGIQWVHDFPPVY